MHLGLGLSAILAVEAVSGGRIPFVAAMFLPPSQPGWAWNYSHASTSPALGSGGRQDSLAGLHSVASSSLKILAASRYRLRKSAPRSCAEMKNHHRKRTYQAHRQKSTEANVGKGCLGKLQLMAAPAFRLTGLYATLEAERPSKFLKMSPRSTEKPWSTN